MPLLLSARSLASSGAAVMPPIGRNVLVLCAHPDDELACAGTVMHLLRKGATTRMVYATSGDATRGSSMNPEEVARARESEAIAACALLGVDDVHFVRLPDGGLPGVEQALATAIDRHIAEVTPEVVLLPWFGDGHRDHQAVCRATVAALLGTHKADTVELWGYETWTPAPVNRLVDVTEHLPVKQAAIAEHRTAALAFDLTAMLGLQRYRSVHGLVGVGYAEGFVVGAPSQYCQWMEEFGSDDQRD